ncbi:MAG TPA: hypothetical protein PKD85_07045 [Saprospiraceae bacterium]|nr:hypothetical protein [Saprospiraceae bacterium]
MSKRSTKTEDKTAAKQFLKIAIGVTVVLMILIYLLVRNAF